LLPSRDLQFNLLLPFCVLGEYGAHGAPATGLFGGLVGLFVVALCNDAAVDSDLVIIPQIPAVPVVVFIIPIIPIEPFGGLFREKLVDEAFLLSGQLLRRVLWEARPRGEGRCG
jgi:hypothetical protein